MTDIVLGTDVKRGDELRLSTADRGVGTYVIGLTGTGKSTLLLNMIVQDIRAGHGLTLLDPHGDLALDVLRHIPPGRQRDVVYLDFGNTQMVPGFDIFASPKSTEPGDDASQQAGVVEAFHKLLGNQSWGPRIERLLNHTAVTFRQNPGCTLTEMPFLLTSQVFRRHCIAHLAPLSTERVFWEDFDRRTERDQQGYIESTMTKIEAFIGNPILKHIMGQPGKVPDFKGILDGRKILVVRMPSGTLKNVTRFIGYLFADRLLKTAFSRERLPAFQRTFHAIYCDEFQYFATPDFEEFIAGGRKYGIGLLLAHQWRDQVDREMQSATIAARSKIVFQVSSEDAPGFTRLFTTTAKEIRPEPVIPTWASLAGGFPENARLDAAIKELNEHLTWAMTSLAQEEALYREQELQFVSFLAEKRRELPRYIDRFITFACRGELLDGIADLNEIIPWRAGKTTNPYMEKHRDLRERLIKVLNHDLVEFVLALVDFLVDENERAPERQATASEIARDLSRLPSRTAKCTLMQNGRSYECTLATHAPFSPISDPTPIISESHRLYCMSARVIDQKLSAWQQQLARLEANAKKAAEQSEAPAPPPPRRPRKQPDPLMIPDEPPW